MMEILQAAVGDRVRVRQRTWTVQDVDSYPGCRIFTLAQAAHDGTARTCRVIHPFDDIEPVHSSSFPARVSMHAWRRACRELIVQHGDAASLRTAAEARLELLPYQLEPALALLHGLGARLLIADEVGLGKTVQAMLAVSELRARGAAPRLLIVCPAGLREQWAEECATRFNLSLAILDQAGVRRAGQLVPTGGNPWTTQPLAVASIDYVKRPEVLPLVLAGNWDVVIIDEAHGASGQSERRHAVERLCHRAPYVLLLTATPHSGNEQAFAALCGFGDHGDRLVVFRRTRLETGRDAGRRTHTIRVPMTNAERRMHAALAALTTAIRREATHMDRHVWLMLSLLHKRALSSPYALARSAERRLALLGDFATEGADQLVLPLDDSSGELDPSDSPPMWSRPALRNRTQERRLLENLLETARQAEGTEGKLARVRRLLDSVREPVIVFTEYRDTLLHVRSQLAPGAAIVHGGMTREQRRAALEAFPAAGVLLATDAAGEGLNLQRQCRCVINLELPWNPMRLEQRIGRVDRIGQQRRVHVFHLVSRGTGEVPLLERLASRIAEANARVGTANPLCSRPAWTEEATARLIVLDDEAAIAGEAPATPVPMVPVTRLQAEGESEAARIASRRMLAAAARTAGDSRDEASSSLLVARTRRRRLRTVLRGRSLAVFRSVMTDAGGRLVATHVGAALLDGEHSDGARTEQLRQGGRAICSPGWEQWRAGSMRAHHQMTTLRVARARAIAAMLRCAPGDQQPGLFDRRAEHEWDDKAEQLRALVACAEERVARAEAALCVSVRAPELALLLHPRRGVSRG